MSFFLGLVSLCTLTLLAYERYNMACKPMAGFKLSVRRSCQGLLFIWLYCLFWAVAPLLGWSSYGPEGVQTSCSLAWEERSWSNYSYLIFYTLLCFILPTAVIVYCYSNVLVSMRKVGHSFLLLTNNKDLFVVSMQMTLRNFRSTKALNFKGGRTVLRKMSMRYGWSWPWSSPSSSAGCLTPPSLWLYLWIQRSTSRLWWPPCRCTLPRPAPSTIPSSTSLLTNRCVYCVFSDSVFMFVSSIELGLLCNETLQSFSEICSPSFGSCLWKSCPVGDTSLVTPVV